jgi:hypothetical protein
VFLMDPENLAPCCDYRFRAHRSVVAVRWSHSVSKRRDNPRARFWRLEPALAGPKQGRSFAVPVQSEL